MVSNSSSNGKFRFCLRSPSSFPPTTSLDQLSATFDSLIFLYCVSCAAHHAPPLQERFALRNAQLVAYVPTSVSPENRLIVASLDRNE